LYVFVVNAPELDLEFVRAEFLDLPCHIRLPIWPALLETRGELAVGTPFTGRAWFLARASGQHAVWSEIKERRGYGAPEPCPAVRDSAVRRKEQMSLIRARTAGDAEVPAVEGGGAGGQGVVGKQRRKKVGMIGLTSGPHRSV
jgi:hypothetical protein